MYFILAVSTFSYQCRVKCPCRS